MTLKTSLIFLFHLTKNLQNQILRNFLKMVIFHKFLAITRVSNLIETWGFRVDDPCDIPDIPISPHTKITKPNSMQPLKNCDFCSFFAITPVWDLIETWGFCMDDPCDFPDIPISPHKRFTKSNLTYQIFQMVINQ